MSVFEGKKAFIVGGTGGIGKRIGLRLAAAGAEVTVHGSRPLSAAAEAEFSDAAAGCGKISSIAVPFSSETFKECCAAIVPYCRTADILCVCYGPFIQKALDDTEPADWQDMALLDYALPGFCVSTALPHMTAVHWGRILLFGGTRTQTVQGFRTNAAYAGAKTGVCSLVKSVALQYADSGVSCNALLPGFVDTEYISAAVKRELAKKMPDGSLIPADEAAEAALFLLASGHINGALLNIDKGWNP